MDPIAIDPSVMEAVPMDSLILVLGFFALLLISCVFLSNISSKIGVPFLLFFILLGVIIGNLEPIGQFLHLEHLSFFSGPHPVLEKATYDSVKNLCTAALIIIMFYGGFGTSWKTSKCVSVEAGLLATVGVLLTAAFTTLVCLLLGWPLIPSLAIGAVTSSTDAASVFAILRNRNLGLKNGLAPLLEIESGANDPCSNILTLIVISIATMPSGVNAGNIALMFVQQLGIGALSGAAIAYVAVKIFKHMKVISSGYNSLLMLSIALFSYVVPTGLGGNGYLSAYLVGIVLGNSDYISGKKELVHFFDGTSGLMQVIIFCFLGFLVKPSSLGTGNILAAVGLFLGITLIARPLTVGMVLAPFRKYTFKQMLFVSFAGLRGAASIVFAIVAICGAGNMPGSDIFFSVIFILVLLSIGLQGSLLPFFAKKFDLIDPDADVLKTFTDFSENSDLQFNDVDVRKGDQWEGKTIVQLQLPKNILVCNIIKQDGNKIIPNGGTVLEDGDKVIFVTKAFESEGKMAIVTEFIDERSPYINKKIKEYSGEDQVLMIKRTVDHKEETIIPNGNTILHVGDTLYLNKNLQRS